MDIESKKKDSDEYSGEELGEGMRKELDEETRDKVKFITFLKKVISKNVSRIKTSDEVFMLPKYVRRRNIGAKRMGGLKYTNSFYVN